MNEHTETHLDNYSFEKYIWQMLSEVHRHHLPIEIIGQESCERTGIIYPLYRLLIHPETAPTICIVAGIHGNEIAGPLSILRILESYVHELPSNFRYLIYPIINPTGYDLRQRYDDDGRDLNAIYHDTLTSKKYGEVQAFYNDVIQFGHLEAVITLHEDSDLEKFYMYGLGKENLDFYHALCAFAKIWCQPWANADIYGCRSDETGLILAHARDHAFDGALYHQKVTPLAFTLETPGKLDILFRVNLMVQLVLQSLRILAAKEFILPQVRYKMA